MATDLQQHTAKIVAAYLSQNPLPADRLGEVMATVATALREIPSSHQQPFDGAPMWGDDRQAAVPIEDSVTHDTVTCLECGKIGKTIKEHIASVHRITLVQYRQRWGLSSDHPLVAPATSSRMSEAHQQRWKRYRQLYVAS